MGIKELEKNCLATCFKFINDKIVYPSKIKDLSFMIIYPTDGFHLTKEQYTSIFEVIVKYQKNHYCISDIEFEDSFIEKNNLSDLGFTHKILTEFVYEDYKAQDRLFENAIYDIDENWGISIFQDYFSIICSETKVINEIKLNYSNVVDLEKFTNFIESTEITNKAFKNELLSLLSKSL